MKKTWNLSVKSLCVLLPLICICIYAWKHPLSFMDNEAPYYLWNKEKTNTRQDKDYNILVLGDSTANAAYAPELLSGDMLNLALGGATPMEAYYILEEWLCNNPTPKLCYISFYDQHLQSEDCFWTRTIYSHRFGIKQNFEMLKESRRFEETSVIKKNYITDFISYELFWPNKYITSLTNAGLNQRLAENTDAVYSNEIHGGRYILLGSNLEYHGSNVILYDRFYVNPLFDAYYRRLIELCTEHGIQVRIVKLPVSDNVSFTKEYAKGFEEYYENLKKSYPGLTVDCFGPYEKKCFGADTHHLNTKGILQFSKELMECHEGDFASSVFSSGQIIALNDSIRLENRPGQILNWIEGKNYRIIFHDPGKRFLSICNEMAAEKLCRIEIQDEEDVELYSVSGLDEDKRKCSVSVSEGNICVQINDQEVQLGKIGDNDILSMAVFDPYDNLVTLKTFTYHRELFDLNV